MVPNYTSGSGVPATVDFSDQMLRDPKPSHWISQSSRSTHGHNTGSLYSHTYTASPTQPPTQPSTQPPTQPATGSDTVEPTETI